MPMKDKEKKREQINRWRRANPEKVRATNMRGWLKLNLANKNISSRTLAAWSAQVKQKDCNSCRDCGSTVDLHAHHILPKLTHPEKALEIENGTTLCESCHMFEHSIK